MYWYTITSCYLIASEPMSKKKSKEGWWQFCELCAKVKSPSAFDELFEVFLTMGEQDDVADRYLIVRDLLQGEKTQRDMAESLDVSIAKITRGSNQLKRVGEKVESFLISKMT